MASTNVSAFLRRLTREMVAETLAAESDRQLVEQFLARRGEAVFESIVRRHGPMVYRVCWRVLRQEQDTEDAFQATFVILAQRLRTLRKRASLASWLHGVAHRVALKAKAEAAVRRRHEQQAVESSAGPPDEVTWGELRGLLDSELAELPEKWRQPLILCFLVGRTQDEAAKQLGWSERTLRRRLEEGRGALGRRLTRRGVVWPAALSALLLSNCVAPAALPSALVGSTVEAANLFAAGQVVTTGLVSAKVVTLAEGVTKAMFITKLKTATAALMLLAAIGLGSAVVLNQMSAAEPLVKANPARPAEAPAPKVPAIERIETEQNVKKPMNHKADPQTEEALQFPAEPEQGEPVLAVKYGFTAEWMATAEMDGKVRLWNTKLQRPGPVLHGPNKMVRSVAFTPDSETLVAGCDDGKIYVWDVRVGKLQSTLEGHRGCVGSVALASDGKTLASSAWSLEREVPICRELKIWDLARGKLVRDIEIKDDISGGGACAMAFAPNTQLLAAACTGQFRGIKVWDTTTGKETKRFAYDFGFPLVVAISRNGKWLASGGGDAIPTSPQSSRIVGSLKVWDWESGKLQKTLMEGGSDYYRAVAFSKDSTRLVAGSSGPQVTRNSVTFVSSVVHCWEAKEWTRLWTSQGLYGGVWSLDISPDGQTVTSSDASGTSIIDAVFGRVRGYLLTTPQKVATEEFGPARVGRPEWPHGVVNAVDLDSRVYSSWGNGTETFFYRDRARALNEAMRKYAAVDADIRQLVLLPGPAKTQTLGGKPVVFDWQLQVPGGLNQVVSRNTPTVMTVYISAQKTRPVDRQQFEKWLQDLNSDSFPIRTVAQEKLQKLGNDAKPLLRAALKGQLTLEARRRIESLLDRLPSIDLADLEIPKGFVIISVDELIAKGIQELKQRDRNVRSRAIQDLSGLARFSDKIVPALVEIFEKDKDVHIRQMAAACLAHVEVQAKPAMQALKQGLNDPDANIRHACQNTLKRLANVQDTPDQQERISRDLAISKEINELKKATGGND